MHYFLHLDSILPKIFGGFASKPPMEELMPLPQLELDTKFLQITSKKITWTMYHT